MNKFLTYLLSIPLIILGFLIGYNWKFSQTTFFDISLYQITYIFIVVYISYYLTQRQHDKRKLKEKAEDLLNKLSGVISDERFILIKNEEDIQYVNQEHRRVSNLVNLLSKLKFSKDYNINIDVILHKVDSHRTIIGNHLNDVEHLSKCNEDFSSIVSIIQTKIDDCVVEIYMN